MSAARDHTCQENFVPYRNVLLHGGTKDEAIARHFGIPVTAIREIEWSEDVCHLGLFVHRLVVAWEIG